MAFEKIIHRKRHRQIQECFVKIISGLTPSMNFNVWASREFGLDIKRVDVYVDANNNEILIIPNNEHGQYAVVKQRNRENIIITCTAFLKENPDIDTNQRYLVSMCDKGMKFKFKRIPDFYRQKGGDC